MTRDFDGNKYRPGLSRTIPESGISHLYEIGDGCMDFLNPMCRYGWNRDNGSSYSIWRNIIGSQGICKICLKRARKGLKGVESR